MKIELNIFELYKDYGPIKLEINTPNDWKPSFNEFVTITGGIKILTEKFAEHFQPKGDVN